MAQVCDYIVILDGSFTVTPSQQFTRHFGTGGRTGSRAVMIFNLNSAGEAHDIQVRVNNHQVGILRNYHNEDPRNIHSQTITFPANRLNNGDNIIEIDIPSGDLVISDIVCWFNQNA